jgi:hypothetical protein
MPPSIEIGVPPWMKQMQRHVASALIRIADGDRLLDQNYR